MRIISSVSVTSARPCSTKVRFISPVFIEAAKARNTDSRITFSQADATALPFADDAFDRA
ncbi:MAG: class I SAM-dependent methyltransferase, partial [Mesorhizobium sp.]